MAMSEVTIHTPPQEEAPLSSQGALQHDQEAGHTSPNSSSSDSPLSMLAQMAASEGGKRLNAQPPSVFEGAGKLATGGESNKDNAAGLDSVPPRQSGSPVVGGVRVMPVANDEMQKIL
ncbi:hypothetical protein cyc_06911 [Cyclospora cayetanensis]|uniref:Uncharacterized protein n=1 Tax=Cyclospora cayetanensis TaxID=88456 RepID=A0A1D3CTA0_9EIME|nr:hypothetical protein cyc_06911 [Cyclospora cayetanensis]